MHIQNKIEKWVMPKENPVIKALPETLFPEGKRRGHC